MELRGRHFPLNLRIESRKEQIMWWAIGAAVVSSIPVIVPSAVQAAESHKYSGKAQALDRDATHMNTTMSGISAAGNWPSQIDI
jgi:hypothetical protein